jgi:hypothetical protein
MKLRGSRDVSSFLLLFTLFFSKMKERNVQPFPHLELTQLPRLPGFVFLFVVCCYFHLYSVPELKDTCRRMREALEPLSNKEELARLDEQIKEFLKPGSEEKMWVSF